MIGTIVIEFASGIAQCQSPGLEFCLRRAAVHYLAVLCENGCKADHSSIRIGHTINKPANIFLGYARTRSPHGSSVHLITYGARILYFINLQLVFHRAHFHNGFDKFQ